MEIKQPPEEVVLIITLSDQPFTTDDLVYGQIMNIPEIFQYDSRIDYITYYNAPLKKVVSKRVDSSLRQEIERLKEERDDARSDYLRVLSLNTELVEALKASKGFHNWRQEEQPEFEQMLILVDDVLSRTEGKTTPKE